MSEEPVPVSLKASNVFLDTVVFIEANFNYKSPRCEALARLAADGRIQVFLTQITLREVKANLKDLVARAVTKPHPILRNSTSPKVASLFEPLDVRGVQSELLRQLKQFLKRAKVTVLPLDPDALTPVLNSYFARRPPFGVGKNKAEFPDALALHALEAWCERERKSIAVVTRDEGVRGACLEGKPLHHFEDLAQYLNAVASEDETLSAFIREQLPKHDKVVFKSAKEAFPNFGCSLTDQDGDVDEIELVDIDYVDDIEIISLSPDGAIVEMPATLTFTAEISYYEPGTGSYDSEDGIVMFQDTVEEKVTRTTDRSIGVEITFEGLDPDSFEVHGVWFEGSENIDIESDYDKDWPHK